KRSSSIKSPPVKTFQLGSFGLGRCGAGSGTGATSLALLFLVRIWRLKDLKTAPQEDGVQPGLCFLLCWLKRCALRQPMRMQSQKERQVAFYVHKRRFQGYSGRNIANTNISGCTCAWKEGRQGLCTLVGRWQQNAPTGLQRGLGSGLDGVQDSNVACKFHDVLLQTREKICVGPQTNTRHVNRVTDHGMQLKHTKYITHN
ncbi:hypothetical protein C0J52_25695, partial [Blattella germanica]